MAETGVDYIKIGFFETEDLPNKLKHFTPPQRTTRLIAVLFADRRPALAVIDQLADAGFVGIMLDTAAKQQGNLLSHQSPEDLTRFVQHANRLGLITGLAGSLSIEDIPLLSSLGADYLGFRGALCHQDRTSSLSSERLDRIRQHLDHCISNQKVV
jgi:dihydroneopterin aldolase